MVIHEPVAAVFQTQPALVATLKEALVAVAGTEALLDERLYVQPPVAAVARKFATVAAFWL